MAERKAIPKKTRFEVFKRDRFTCQYCGRKSPEVILEVDHIKPVAEGGNNGVMNLVTACRECNRGKGKTLLSKNEEVTKQRKQMEELADKREQLEMLMKWQNELVDYENAQAEKVNEYIGKLTGWACSETGKGKIKTLIRRFSLPEVIEGIDISFSTYYSEGDERSWYVAFNKIGGVCYNRRKQGLV